MARAWQCGPASAAAGPLQPQPSWFDPGSFGGRIPQHIADLAPKPLTCVPAREREDGFDGLIVVHAGNEHGCAEHTTHAQYLHTHELTTPMPDVVAHAEQRARRVDPRDLLECRFFGPCGAGWDNTDTPLR